MDSCYPREEAERPQIVVRQSSPGWYRPTGTRLLAMSGVGGIAETFQVVSASFSAAEQPLISSCVRQKTPSHGIDGWSAVTHLVALDNAVEEFLSVDDEGRLPALDRRVNENIEI